MTPSRVSRPVRAKDKIVTRRPLAALVRQLRRRGQQVVFANGCFDLLHVGHVSLLEQAKQAGDILIVGINSDRSVRSLKGPARPILPERERALLVASLGCVDFVTVFDEPTPYALISALKPTILVKGADWKADQIVGRDVVEREGGRVVRIRLVEGHSTTRLIGKIQAGRPCG